MSDLISRQAAIDAFRKELCREREYATPFISLNGCERILNELPSAERHGKWILYKRHTKGSPYILFDGYHEPEIQYHQIEVTRYKCSLCGVVEDVNTPFCSECGAKMDDEENE